MVQAYEELPKINKIKEYKAVKDQKMRAFARYRVLNRAFSELEEAKRNQNS